MHKEQRYLRRVTVDITTRCNLRCIMCPPRDQIVPYDMPLSVFTAIARDILPHARALFLSCAYEALLSPHLIDILHLVRGAAVPEIALITNATRLDERLSRELVDTGITTLIVSLDGATAATYERIRRGARFDAVCANVRGFVRATRAARNDHLDVNVTVTVMRSTISEVADIVPLAAGLGAASVNFKPVQPLTSAVDGEALVYPADLDAVKRMVADARAHAAREGIRVTIAPELTAMIDRHDAPPAAVPSGAGITQGSRHRCMEPSSLYIQPSGDVWPCTIWNQPSLGVLGPASFSSIWESERYARLRASHDSGIFEHTCQACCYMDSDERRETPVDGEGHAR